MSGLALGKIGKCGRFIAVLRQLIEWNFQSGGELFQSLNGRNRETVFYPGYVTPEQARALLDVSLRKTPSDRAVPSSGRRWSFQ
jgi:hypothetical protein